MASAVADGAGVGHRQTLDERTGIDMGASVAVLGPQIAGLPEVVD